MRYYIDTSALLKRVVDEPEAADLRAALDIIQRTGGTILTSVIARVEVARSLRQAVAAGRFDAAQAAAAGESVFEGVDVVSLRPSVVDEAKSIGSDSLRSLDAIHLATAWLIRAPMVIAYNQRLLEAAREAGLMTMLPGVSNPTLPPGWAWIGGSDEDDAG